MDTLLFADLLKGGESDIVDFKEFGYFNSSEASKKDKDAEFIKDIISLVNTVRQGNAYIIIGVKDNGQKVGITEADLTDGADLKNKVTNKVYPIPIFKSYSFTDEDGFLYQIIEIPVIWYSTPCTPTFTSGNTLERKRIYLRRNNSNEEATHDEQIRLYEWLKGLTNLESTTPYTEAELVDFSNALFDETGPIQEDLVEIEVKWWRRRSEGKSEELSRDKELSSDKKLSRDFESCPALLNFNKLLLTGAAGAGKTTVMRNHYVKAVNKLKVTPKDQDIPLWIDLKLFKFNKDVTFLTAIKQYLNTVLKNKISRQFIINHLEELYKEGRLVFYFDSFDEHKFDNEQKLSKEIRDLWNSRNKIIVAARRETKPTDDFNPDTFIDVLPISKKAIAKYFGNQMVVLEELFKDKYRKLTENIFYLSLLKRFWNKHSRLPENLFALYNFSFKEKYDLLSHSNKQFIMPYEDALKGLELIVKEYYTLKKTNKEAAISLSSSKILQTKPELVHLLTDLEKVGFFRYKDNSYNSFYFSHKIYEDFFIARCFNSKLLSTTSIKPGEDKGPLYLYCSIAAIKQAKNELNKKWERIKNITNLNANEKSYTDFLENLDFITNAFKYRQDIVANIKDALIYLLGQIVSKKDFLLKKYAVRAFALLEQAEVEGLLQKNPSLFAISGLREELLLICRNYEKLNLQTEKMLVSSFIDRAFSETISNISDSVAFSTALKPVSDFILRSRKDGRKIITILIVYYILYSIFAFFMMPLEDKPVLCISVIYFCSFLSLFSISLFSAIYFRHGISWNFLDQLRYRFKYNRIKLFVVPILIIIATVVSMYLYLNSNRQSAMLIIHGIFSLHGRLVALTFGAVTYPILRNRYYSNKYKKQDISKQSSLETYYADLTPTRVNVEADFKLFATAKGRVGYINFIKTKLANNKFTEIWTNGRRPYINDYDEASFQLAEIDENSHNRST